MYTALYRKWRPSDFENIVGQDHITRALRNQVDSNRIAHAYLFYGPRGTGKTCTARVFARAINCIDSRDGDPCGVCAACAALADENNLDIIEIDAASNNGVDEIREIREKVKFPPVSCRYKVYIIDEVHMLSTGAFNALLKTLEEPPSHAVFILATTEQHKLPATIVSRCQRYDFRRFPTKVIADRLKVVLSFTDTVFSDEAIQLIARSAEGGMRDALNIADMALAIGNTVGYDDVAMLIGAAGKEALYELAENMINMDVSSALEQIDGLSYAGRDMTVLARDLTEHFRSLMIYLTCKSADKVLDVGADVLAIYKRQAEKAGFESVMFNMSALSDTEYQMRGSQRPRTLLEMTIIRICSPVKAENIDELSQRLARLERLIESGAVKAKIEKPLTAEAEKAPEKIIQEEKTEAKETDIPDKPREQPIPGYDDPLKLWGMIKNKVKQKNSILYMMIQDVTNAKISGDKLIVTFPKSMKPNYEIAVKPDRMAVIKEAAGETGMPLSCNLRLEDASPIGSSDKRIKLAEDLFGAENIVIKE